MLSKSTWLAMNPGLSLSPADMSPEFDALVDRAWQNAHRLVDQNKSTWGIGEAERWDIDQTTGLLVFSYRDGSKAICEAQIIGSYANTDKSWLWAWANDSFLPHMCQDAIKVFDYGKAHGSTLLTKSWWYAEEIWPWAMTALAIELTQASGWYRGPGAGSAVFMTFRNVSRQSPQ